MRIAKEITTTVTILLPVYNAGEYLRESVASALRQTYRSFELLVIDDGSTDGCTDFLKNIGDRRIRLIRRRHDYIATLNYGLSSAKGKYIARMDADDRMLPSRLARQVRVMEENPEIAVCSSYIRHVGGHAVYGGLSGTLKDYAPALLLGNFIVHPTVMLRTEYLREHKLRYRRNYIYAEDYKLWTDIACLGGQLHIIPKPLLEYRISDKQVSLTHSKEQAETACRIRNELLGYLIKHSVGRYAPPIRRLFSACANFNADGLMDDSEIFSLFYKLFTRINSQR